LPPEPLILAFDTSAAHCAVALLEGPEVLTGRVEDMARGQAEHLMPMLDSALKDQGRRWDDLAAIGVGIGPGNFTGIRIAVAAARGLALSLGIPAIGVNGFEALSLGQSGPVWALINARRDMFYAQYQGGVPLQLTTPEVDRLRGPRIMRTDLPAEVFTGNIARIAASRYLQPQPRPAPLYIRPPDAAPSSIAPPVMLP